MSIYLINKSKFYLKYFPLYIYKYIHLYLRNLTYLFKKVISYPVTDRRGLEGCKASRISHFVDIRDRDGGEVMSLFRRTHFTLKNISGTFFC
jgi:hypothetical protein